MSLKHSYLAAIFAVLACASGGSGAGPTGTRPAYLLSAEEITANHADNLTAYDAVARLRPNWLASHGVTSGQALGADTEYASVFVDGQEVGGLAALRNINAYQVGDIRYWNVAEAGARFGIRAGSSGAIEVTLKAPNRR